MSGEAQPFLASASTWLHLASDAASVALPIIAVGWGMYRKVIKLWGKRIDRLEGMICTRLDELTEQVKTTNGRLRNIEEWRNGVEVWQRDAEKFAEMRVSAVERSLHVMQENCLHVLSSGIHGTRRPEQGGPA